MATGLMKMLNPIEMLTVDHHRVETLFEDFKRARGWMKRAIIMQIVQELTVHARLEEEIFYPAVREHLGPQGVELADRARRDHDAIDAAVHDVQEALGQSESASPEIAERLLALRRQVKEHAEWEEWEMFPQTDGRLALHELAAALNARKAQLMLRHPTPRALAFLVAGLLGAGVVMLLLSRRGQGHGG